MRPPPVIEPVLCAWNWLLTWPRLSAPPPFSVTTPLRLRAPFPPLLLRISPILRAPEFWNVLPIVNSEPTSTSMFPPFPLAVRPASFWFSTVPLVATKSLLPPMTRVLSLLVPMLFTVSLTLLETVAPPPALRLIQASWEFGREPLGPLAYSQFEAAVQLPEPLPVQKSSCIGLQPSTSKISSSV